jgi:nucleolar protein 53
LRKFKKEINKVEKTVDVKKENRRERNEQKKLAPGRLGKLKFEEEEFPIKESPEELGNLRKLEPEGNILIDRFKSMQKRKMLAPSRRKGTKKSAVVKIKKRSFKEEMPIKVPQFK